MKSSKFTHLLVIGLALTCAVAGCVKKPVHVTDLPGTPSGRAPSGGNLVSMPPIGSDTGVKAGPGTGPIVFDDNNRPPYETWGHDPSTFAAQTVYFDLDSTVVKSSEKTKIQAVASYLQANARNAVQVEGHCDERGTEEYNRALGERRALALREELVMLGVAPVRVDTVSYGEDRPADAGHTAEAWTKNRRGAFVLLTPPR